MDDNSLLIPLDQALFCPVECWLYLTIKHRASSKQSGKSCCIRHRITLCLIFLY